MAEEEGRGRAKRRCARNKYVGGAMPSAIHYVGYVSAAAAQHAPSGTHQEAAPMARLRRWLVILQHVVAGGG